MNKMELTDGFAPMNDMMTGKSTDVFTQHTFTTTQYNKILHLLEREDAGKAESYQMINMAGMDITPILSVSNSRMQGKIEERWIVDSGATCHMTHSADKLCSASSCVNRKVHLPNGETVQVSHIGCCDAFDKRTLENVLVVPDFKHNLLSVSKLTKQLHCSVNFFPEYFVLQDLSSGRVKGIGKEHDGLYYLPMISEGTKEEQKVLMAQSSTAERLVWHSRLGHPSMNMLQQLLKNKHPSDSDACGGCSVYPLAKQTRLPFPTSVSRALGIFDLLHMDVWGPYRVATHSGFRFFLTIVDDHSRICWLYLMKLKSDVFSILKSFLKLVHIQFNKNVKIIRTDNGAEFFNNECDSLLKSLGIVHESSCPYTP